MKEGRGHSVPEKIMDKHSTCEDVQMCEKVTEFTAVYRVLLRVTISYQAPQCVMFVNALSPKYSALVLCYGSVRKGCLLFLIRLQEGAKAKKNQFLTNDRQEFRQQSIRIID